VSLTNSYNIRTGFHSNNYAEIVTVFNCLLSSALFGFNKTVLAIPNLAFQIGVLSAQYCASHSVQAKSASPAAAWCLCFIIINN
jgi:hypothetical protein